MNRKEIEEMMRMRDLVNPHRKIIEEMNRMRDSLNPYRNELNQFKELQNLQKDEIKRIKELQNPHLDNFPRNNLAEKLHRDYLNSTAARNQLNELKEINKQRHSLSNDFGASSYLKAIEELKINAHTRQGELFNQPNPNNLFDVLQNLRTNDLSRWQNQTAFALSLKQKEIDKFFSEATTAVKAATGLPRNFYDRDYWNTINGLRGTFVSELTASMRSVIADAQDDEQIIEKLESLVEEKLTSLPENDFSRAVLWQIVIGILSLLLAIYGSGLATYQFIDSQKSSEEQKTNAEKVIQLLQKIADNNSEEIEEDVSIYYIVKRPLTIKTQPKFNAMTIGFLSPGTKVKLLESNHKWVFVEFIDYFEVVPRYGWVSKKYLARITTTKSRYQQRARINESDSWSDEDLKDFRKASSNYVNELLGDEDEW